MIDWTINLGTAIEIVVLLGGVLAFFRKIVIIESKITQMWVALMGKGEDVRDTLPWRVAQLEHDKQHIFSKLGMPDGGYGGG